VTDIVIRRAEPSDAEGIAATFRSRGASLGTLQNPYPSIAQWTERLRANEPTRNYVLVALAGEEIRARHGCQPAARRDDRLHAPGALGLWGRTMLHQRTGR